jgi:hypothetical protein
VRTPIVEKDRRQPWRRARARRSSKRLSRSRHGWRRRSGRSAPAAGTLSAQFSQPGTDRCEIVYGTLEKARNHTPAHSMLRRELAAAYGLPGETISAAGELAEARRLSPTIVI